MTSSQAITNNHTYTYQNSRSSSEHKHATSMLQSTRGALSSRLVCWSLSFLRCCNLAVNQHVEGMQALKDSQTPKKYICNVQISSFELGGEVSHPACCSTIPWDFEKPYKKSRFLGVLALTKSIGF